MKTLEERLTSYRAAFLEKVKRWNWNDEEECSYKPRGRKPKAAKPRYGGYRNEAEKREWEKQQQQIQQQATKKNKYNWL